MLLMCPERLSNLKIDSPTEMTNVLFAALLVRKIRHDIKNEMIYMVNKTTESRSAWRSLFAHQ